MYQRTSALLNAPQINHWSTVFKTHVALQSALPILMLSVWLITVVVAMLDSLIEGGMKLNAVSLNYLAKLFL